MTHLPYKGSAPALNALVAGHIQVMFTDLAPSLRLIRRGKLRALGITTAERAARRRRFPRSRKWACPATTRPLGRC